MLNFIYYPVSWIMWVWHWLFDKITPDSPGWSGVAWALSVVFLVFTLRAILYKPFVKQVTTTKKMQEINPQMQAIRKKYGNDRVKMTEEMQKLQKEHGFNPLLGCLPMLLQIPVFIGLFHVLRSFNRMGGGTAMPFGHPAHAMSAAETRSTGNYGFSPELVENFLDARLFGVPLSSYISEPVDQFQAFVQPGAPVDFERWQIVAVAVPLMILSSFATHMNSRASVARQTMDAANNPQTRIMNRLALWVFPIGILATGFIFPIAILLYWVSNNAWTYAQQHIVFGRMAKEEEMAKLVKEEKQKAAAPRPGEKPLPNNFDPKKTMDRGYAALAEGRTGDASTEFRKVLRYGQRKSDWLYRGSNGIARAGYELALLADQTEARASLSHGSIDIARKDAVKPDAELPALERYLSMRFWQGEGWLESGENERVFDLLSGDESILKAYERAWTEDAQRPAELAPYRRASLQRLVAVANFRAGRNDQARTAATKAIEVLTTLDVDPTIALQLAQLKIIVAAPAPAAGRTKRAAPANPAAAQEALALLTDAANEDGATAAAKSRAERTGAWTQKLEAAAGGGRNLAKDEAAGLQQDAVELVTELLESPDAVHVLLADGEVRADVPKRKAAPQEATAKQGGGTTAQNRTQQNRKQQNRGQQNRGQQNRGQQNKPKKKRKGGRI